MVVGLGLNFDENVFQCADNLKVMGIVTTSLDHAEVVYKEAGGIQATSLKSETTFLQTITGSTELALGFLLDIVQNISSRFDPVKNYEWSGEEFKRHGLVGKVLGVVGCGEGPERWW